MENLQTVSFILHPFEGFIQTSGYSLVEISIRFYSLRYNSSD